MKKLLSLILPIAIIFSLAGCGESETEYIRKDLRKTFYLLDGSDQIDPDRKVYYEVNIDGKWYDADENGELTEWGKAEKRVEESSGGGC